MKRILGSHPISEYMTTTPRTIEPHQPLSSALNIMEKGHFHHLPVCAGGKVVGVISESDLNFYCRFSGHSPEKATVNEIMIPAPVVVNAENPLSEVIYLITNQKISSVVVIDKAEHVLGIFTLHDAARMLLENITAT